MKIRVRARTVDLLGRQQIAGIPTAIHELFKNAHDAYAKRVEVDYFRADKTFALRDDGYGMTRQDFANKWLTLATENQLEADRTKVPDFLPKNTPLRPVMGEKGIGRLAVATIGEQTLVLTRAKRGRKFHKLVAGFIHWGLFEIPRLDLEAIDIPVMEMSGEKIPGKKEVHRLLNQVRENIKSFGTKIPANTRKKILSDLDNFSIFPAEIEGLLKGPKLTGRKQGTHFYIMPTDDVLDQDIDDIMADTASSLEKTLIGFANTMDEDSKPVILTRFREHTEDDRVIEHISEKEFFTPKEFKKTDHYIEGEFDEYGVFEGLVGIYGTKPATYKLEWPDADGNETWCGSFSFKVGVIQGKPNESNLSKEAHAIFTERLKKIGGIYIYLDGIRILPYGNSDYDFLNIEYRRTKSAQDWFFSYRRLFGAIKLTRAQNPEMKEKAGREGFIQNKAYRQMRNMLENLFEQLAKDFFRPEGSQSKVFNRFKKELEKQNEDLEKRVTRIKKQKDKFRKQLSDFFIAVDEGKPDQEISALIEKILKKTKDHKKFLKTGDPGRAVSMDEFDSKFEHLVIDRKYIIKRPKIFALNKEELAAWQAYLETSEGLEKNIFGTSEKEIHQIYSDLRKKIGTRTDIEKRTREAMKIFNNRTLDKTEEISGAVINSSKKLQKELLSRTEERVEKVKKTIERIMARLDATDFKKIDEKKAFSLQKEIENSINTATKEENEWLEGAFQNLNELIEAVKRGDNIGEETAALEGAYLNSREELDLYSDLAQVGMALSIVHHEFSSTVKNVNLGIQQLEALKEHDEDLEEAYRNIHDSFQHLEGYLALFAPLNKRLQKRKIQITGEEIRKFVWELFEDRIQRHKIDFDATPAFRKIEFEAYPSTIFPVFVNIVDNAIYWISTKRGGTRKITLGADSKGFVIENTGPGIPLERKNWIFEYSNTLKRGGRGIGLYISRQALNHEGFKLALENPGKNKNPRFRIFFPEKTDE